MNGNVEFRADEIMEAYYDTDRHFALATVTHRDNTQRWYDLQKINEQVYFVGIFARFDFFVEQKLKDEFSSDDADYEDNTFLQKVNTFLGGTEHYDRVQSYYHIRCDIAHGRNHRVDALNLATLLDELRAAADFISRPEELFQQ